VTNHIGCGDERAGLAFDRRRMVEKPCRDPDGDSGGQQPGDTGRRRIQPEIMSADLVACLLPQREGKVVHVNLHPATGTMAPRRTVEADRSRHFRTGIFSKSSVFGRVVPKATVAFVSGRAMLSGYRAGPGQRATTARRNSWTAQQTPSGKAI
jgi:hypothetical protein